MCGAFSILHPFREIGRHFNAGYNDELTKSPQRYNIRPSQAIPVIFNTEPATISLAFWGIHPTYDKTKKMFLINARSDSLSKPTWKHLLQAQRCLIPADGFYEWQKGEGKTKIPYRFELKQQALFAFAGLWHEEKDGKATNPHCVIITTEPNALVNKVHDRMPAILTKENESKWLNPDLETNDLLKLLKPFSAKEMQSFKVTTELNSPIRKV